MAEFEDDEEVLVPYKWFRQMKELLPPIQEVLILLEKRKKIEKKIDMKISMEGRMKAMCDRMKAADEQRKEKWYS